MKVAVRKSLLNWAINRSGKSFEELLKKFPKLEQWLEQSEQPTLKQLERFTKATFTPIGKFFLETPPKDILPIADFRTLPNASATPSPHLLDTIYLCQQRQEWYHEHCRAEGYEALNFVGSANINDSPQNIARKIRTDFSLALEEQDINSAFARRRDNIEEQGVLVMCSGVVGSNTRRALDINEFRGFALADDYASIIFVNTKDSSAARSFTLIHELAHIYLGESGVSVLNSKSKHRVERWCNEVAAEVLVPADDFKQRFNDYQGNDYQKMVKLAKFYMVSNLVILNKMKDAGFINKNTFGQMYKEEAEKIQAILSQKGKGGGDFYKTKPIAISKRFGKALTQSTLEGNTLYRDAMQMLGIKKTNTFNRLASKLNAWME